MTYEFYYRRNQETSFEIPAIDNQTPPHSDFEFLHYTKKRPFQATTTTTNTNDAPPPPSTHTRTTNLHKRSLKHEQYQELQAFNTSQRSQVPHSSILNANISTFTPKGTSQLANKDKVIYKKEGGMTESHLYENLSENEKNVRIPAAGARLDPMHSNKHGCPENQKKYASVALVASDEGRMGFMSCYQHRDYTTEYKNCYGLGHQLQTSLPNYGRDLVSNAGANDTHGAPGLGYGNRHHAYHHYIHKPVQAKEECLVKAPAPRLYRGMPGDYEEKMLQLKKNREGQAILMPAERRWQNSSRE